MPQIGIHHRITMGKPQIRLEKDVAVLAAKSASANDRSLPKEVNRLLRELLKSQPAKVAVK